MNPKIKIVLRWISILPVAVIGGFLATFPLHWILYFTLAHGETISGVNIKSVEYVITPFVIGITFILVGFKIAPKYKLKISALLAILWIVSFIGLSSLMQTKLELRGILGLIGVLVGFFINLHQKKSMEAKVNPASHSGDVQTHPDFR
jgi:hypothetical protein